MHPEILSIALFWFVTAYTPGPNNIVASYSGFNFGIKKTIPHIFGTTLGFTSLVFFLTEITVPTLISTLSKTSYVICSFINAVFILIISYEYRN